MIGEARTHGAELSVTHKFSSLWSVYANYTWQLGKVADADNGYAMGRDYEIPRHLFHSGVTYTNHPWTVNVDSMFVSARNEPGWKSGKFKSRDAYFPFEHGYRLCGEQKSFCPVQHLQHP